MTPEIPRLRSAYTDQRQRNPPALFATQGSAVGHLRRIDHVRDESALPPIATVLACLAAIITRDTQPCAVPRPGLVVEAAKELRLATVHASCGRWRDTPFMGLT